MSRYGDRHHTLEYAYDTFETWLEQFNSSDDAELVSDMFEYFIMDLINAYSKKKAELENK